MAIHWLASYPKSGNTWVRAFLEAYLFGRVDINNMAGVISDNRPYLFQLNSCIPYDKLDPYATACIRVAMLHNLSFVEKQRPLVVKTHECNVVLRDMPLIPFGLTGPSVYVMRDPRDVAISYASHMGLDLDTAIEKISTRELGVGANIDRGGLPQIRSSWNIHVRSWASKKYTIVVRYEDILANESKEFRRILQQYGIEYDEERFENARSLSSFTALSRAESTEGFREKGVKQEKFFRKGRSGEWREALTDAQVQRIEKAFGSEMVEHGYTLSMEEVAA